MRLHVDVHGHGPQVAVLLHGLMGSSESWWRVAPLLVEQGFRVLAIDLSGHGLSPRDPELTVERAAQAVMTVEARAAERFDPASAASVAASVGGDWPPAPGSIVIRPEPSDYIDAESAATLTGQGVQVRSIPGATHSIWYSNFDEFVAMLPEAFG